jgi:hypothetical protein
MFDGFTGSEEVSPGRDPRQLLGRADRGDAAERRSECGDLAGVVPLAHRRLEQQHRRLARCQQVRELRWGGERRQRCDHGTGEAGTEIRGDRLGTVRHHGGDPVTRGYAGGDQRPCDRPCLSLEIGVRPADRRTASKRVVEDKGLAGGMASGDGGEESAHRERPPPVDVVRWVKGRTRDVGAYHHLKDKRSGICVVGHR